MTDEERAREFCGLMPHEKITPESYAGRVMAMLAAVRADAAAREREECVAAVNALDTPPETNDANIGELKGLCRAEAAIRARSLPPPPLKGPTDG